MAPDFSLQWQLARELEAKRDLAAADEVYGSILRADPTQAFAWHRLAALAGMQGRPRAAREAALRGAEVAVTHRRWKVLPWLTQQLLAIDERDATSRAIIGADWRAPEVLAQSAVLAQHLWLADAPVEGLELVDATLKAAPRAFRLHYVRASLLRHLGRALEATEAYERCLACEPSFADAHWALAYHVKAEPLGSRVMRVRKALIAAKEPMSKVMLGYALFKELDDAGDADGAWVALSTAAAKMRRQLRYDPVREQLTVQALCDAFPRPVARGAATIGAARRTPVFVVGMPRSGTTVLERILGNHSCFASAGELNAFPNAMAIALDSPFGQPPSKAQVEAGMSADFSAVAADYHARCAARYGGRDFLVDKNPLNLFNAGFIATAMPEAKILCLVRKPMDVCFSNLKELFPGGGYGYSYDMEELAGHWHRFQTMVDHWRVVLPEQFMTVSYESMVQDPERMALEVFNFCGAETEVGCGDIARNQSPVSTASSSQVRQPIHRHGIGAWRRYETVLAPLVERLRSLGASIE